MSGTTVRLDTLNDSRLRMRAQATESLAQAAMFLKNFCLHPRLIGSVFPSSRYLINRVLGHVDWDEIHNVVEYGPGVGTFTRPMLARMSFDARLLAIELNQDFCQSLSADIVDPRFELIRGSAVDVTHWMHRRSMAKADFILSCIPYTFFSHDLRRNILVASRNALAPRGTFVSFQYTRAVLPDLRDVFSQVEEDFELINFLPARVFYCRK